RYRPQSQDGEDFRSHLQYKLPLSAH
ncbi:hypothetical protein, partial [Shigella flexneri]